MSSFYNTNCILIVFPPQQHCFSHPSDDGQFSGLWRVVCHIWNSEEIFEQGGHISCLVVFLCSEARALAGCQRLCVHQALQKGWDWLSPPPPQRSGSQGSIGDSSLRRTSFNRSANQVPALISPPRKSLSSPLLPSCFLCFQSTKSPLVFYFSGLNTNFQIFRSMKVQEWEWCRGRHVWVGIRKADI